MRTNYSETLESLLSVNEPLLSQPDLLVVDGVVEEPENQVGISTTLLDLQLSAVDSSSNGRQSSMKEVSIADNSDSASLLTMLHRLNSCYNRAPSRDPAGTSTKSDSSVGSSICHSFEELSSSSALEKSLEIPTVEETPFPPLVHNRVLALRRKIDFETSNNSPMPDVAHKGIRCKNIEISSPLMSLPESTPLHLTPRYHTRSRGPVAEHPNVLSKAI